MGGIFYAYGFTAAPATVVLLVLAKGQNVILAGLIGGFGALISDIIIYLFIRYSFAEEIEELKKEKPLRLISRMNGKIFGKMVNYIMPIVACIFIASPLPTEIGVSLLATIKKITMKRFILMAYLLHTLGIMTVLMIGNNL